MRLELSRAHYPVTVLGPGRRIAVWVQGCSIRCRGCLSQDTWERDPSKAIEVGELLAWCRDVAPQPDGVTISGGEPFEQPTALSEFLDGLHMWRAELAKPFDILCYSGFSLRRLRARHADILAKLDGIIPEPFVGARSRGGVWRGSDNQPLVSLTPLGQGRYAEYLARSVDGKGSIQVGVAEGRLFYIGIPDRGDMEAQRSTAARAGLYQRSPSWLA